MVTFSQHKSGGGGIPALVRHAFHTQQWLAHSSYFRSLCFVIGPVCTTALALSLLD